MSRCGLAGEPLWRWRECPGVPLRLPVDVLVAVVVGVAGLDVDGVPATHML